MSLSIYMKIATQRRRPDGKDEIARNPYLQYMKNRLEAGIWETTGKVDRFVCVLQDWATASGKHGHR